MARLDHCRFLLLSRLLALRCGRLRGLSRRLTRLNGPALRPPGLSGRLVRLNRGRGLLSGLLPLRCGLSRRLSRLNGSALRLSGLRGLALRCGRLRGLSGRLARLDRGRGLRGRLGLLRLPVGQVLLLTGTLALVLLARLLLRHNDRPVGRLGSHRIRMPQGEC